MHDRGLDRAGDRLHRRDCKIQPISLAWLLLRRMQFVGSGAGACGCCAFFDGDSIGRVRKMLLIVISGICRACLIRKLRAKASSFGQAHC